MELPGYLNSALWAITPTIVLGILFWVVFRAMLRADRTERSAYAKIEREERARLGVELRSADRSQSDRSEPAGH